MKKLVFLLTLSMLFGCGPYVPVFKLDELSRKRIDAEITIYAIDDLIDKEYSIISPIESISCMNRISDPPASMENAILQLRYNTSVLGGNAVTDLRCDKPVGISIEKNCWSSVTCYAYAIKVIPGSIVLPCVTKDPASAVLNHGENIGQNKNSPHDEKYSENKLDQIPPNWPQRYYYEIGDYRYWTICGETQNSQSDAVISAKKKADEIFNAEFPKSKYGDLSYETTHMEINSIGNRYKSWRIIRVPRSN